MRHSLESLSHSNNLDMPSNPEGIKGSSKQKDPWDMSEFRDKMEKLSELINDLPKKPEETTNVPESWDDHVKKANFEKYKSIWEKEKSEADRSGVNPKTGLYEKGRMPIAPENVENHSFMQKVAKKMSSGESLTLTEKMSARDGIIYEFNGYKLKPDCCYRKAGPSEIEHYKKTSFVDGNIDLKTLNRNDGSTIRGRVDTIDWFLGATTPRYGEILIETPAKAEYFVPVEKPGAKGNLLADPDAIHMHSSGIVDPIPMSEVRIIQGPQSSESQDLKHKVETGEISLSDISASF